MDVGGALHDVGQLALQRGGGLALPRAREAAAHAELEQLEGVAACRLVRQRVDLVDLQREAAAAFGVRGGGVEAAEIEFVDQRQHRDLEPHHMHLRPARFDVQRVALGQARMKARWNWNSRRKSTKSDLM